MNESPSPNGRQTGGRFAKGNAGGPGNPFAAEVGKLRARPYKAIKAKDIDAAVKVMREVMEKGKDSDRLAAARLLLDRAMGAPVEADVLERIERLEQAILRGQKR